MTSIIQKNKVLKHIVFMICLHFKTTNAHHVCSIGLALYSHKFNTAFRQEIFIKHGTMTDFKEMVETANTSKLIYTDTHTVQPQWLEH